MDLLYCGASAKQGCGHFYILVIICIWPSGFRTAPRVALKTPKPWNAQSPALLSYQAKLLRTCLSVSLCVTPLCHHPATTKKKVCVRFYARMKRMFMSTRVHAFFVYVALLLPTDGNLRHNAGGLSFEATFPLPIFSPILSSLSLSLSPYSPFLFPSPFCAHQAERKASILHRQAPEPGCRQWKPSPVTTKRQI